MEQKTTPEDKFEYEIHVTVEASDIERFKEVCTELNVKAIVVSLSQTEEYSHVMTSSVFIGPADLTPALLEAANITNSLEAHGFTTVRTKIETVPWHPDAPTITNKRTFKNDQHFECHISFVVRSEEEAAMLAIFAKNRNMHMSRNPFKLNEDGSYIQMVTSRAYMSKYEIFKESVDYIIEQSKRYNFLVYKIPRIEFAIFDTNIQLDDAWVNSKSAKANQHKTNAFKLKTIIKKWKNKGLQSK